MSKYCIVKGHLLTKILLLSNTKKNKNSHRPQALLESLEKSLSCADVVVTTGGVSMGEKDLLKSILTTDLNATLHFGRINMKPGYLLILCVVTPCLYLK